MRVGPRAKTLLFGLIALGLLWAYAAPKEVPRDCEPLSGDMARMFNVEGRYQLTSKDGMGAVYIKIIDGRPHMCTLVSNDWVVSARWITTLLAVGMFLGPVIARRRSRESIEPDSDAPTPEEANTNLE